MSIVERLEISDAKPIQPEGRTIANIVPQDCKYKRFWRKGGLAVRMVVGHSGRWVIFDPDAMAAFSDCPGISIIREGEGGEDLAEFAFYRTQQEIIMNLEDAERGE